MTNLPESTIVGNQIQEHKQTIEIDGVKRAITINLRLDDSCGNGYNSFGMTGDLYEGTKRIESQLTNSGAIGDIIAEHCPEFAHLNKWHLTSTDGPMHYLANTIYHADDKDCWGRRKGEPSAWGYRAYVDASPVGHKIKKSFAAFIATHSSSVWAEVVELEHPKGTFSPKYTLEGMPADAWSDGIWDSKRDAQEWTDAINANRVTVEEVETAWSKGEEPNLEAARRSAVWPDATLEQLQDKDALLARLPGLMEAFRADMEALGFTY